MQDQTAALTASVKGTNFVTILIKFHQQILTEVIIMIRLQSLTFIALLVVAAMVFGCATKKESGALIGAGAGAAVGAGIGAAAGGKEGALIGGAVGAFGGALTGALVGSYMDKQEKEMREKVGNRASIERVGNQLVVKFQSGILFDTDKSDLKTDSVQTLQNFSNVLKDYPKTNLQIEGYTDNIGSDAYNKKLSVSRANSVSSFLMGQGVQQQRLNASGYGEEKPVASNSTPEGRQQNRRVEVKINPIVQQ
jgi:outer membrane protein OmpA-like peptidoglycan-associated protein